MSAPEPTIRIFFEDLAIIGNDHELLPLSHLDLDIHSHIHGGLRIQVQERFLPHMGFFGPDDVCFSVWIVELENVYKAFGQKMNASYTFDEGEQGQPAFLFEKEGSSAYISIVDSEISGGQADADWQKVRFVGEDFRDQYRSMKAAFLSELRQSAPDRIEGWVKQCLPGVTV